MTPVGAPREDSIGGADSASGETVAVSPAPAATPVATGRSGEVATAVATAPALPNVGGSATAAARDRADAPAPAAAKAAHIPGRRTGHAARIATIVIAL